MIHQAYHDPDLQQIFAVSVCISTSAASAESVGYASEYALYISHFAGHLTMKLLQT